MHLALLSARLPRLISEADEDPLFDNDWEASLYLYPRPQKHDQNNPNKTKTQPEPKTSNPTGSKARSKPREQPPVALLVIAVGENIFFDPSPEELAVADLLLAVSICETIDDSTPTPLVPKPTTKPHRNIRLLSLRTIDPPSRLTTPGVPDALNTAVTLESQTETPKNKAVVLDAGVDYRGVWIPPKGGTKRGLIGRIVQMVIEPGGVGEEVLEGLEGVDVG
jgi:exosome complex component RRP42